MMVAQLKLSVIESSNSIQRLTHFLEQPKLIDFAMCGPLNNFIMMLKSFLKNIEVHLTKETFDNIDLSRSEDIPSLVVPIVRFID